MKCYGKIIARLWYSFGKVMKMQCQNYEQVMTETQKADFYLH